MQAMKEIGEDRERPTVAAQEKEREEIAVLDRQVSFFLLQSLLLGRSLSVSFLLVCFSFFFVGEALNALKRTSPGDSSCLGCAVPSFEQRRKKRERKPRRAPGEP